ncbi:pyrroloquinoline quinone biosynthesis peptide chaperone PqqD [Pseudonocardia acaciae]|uniref:pyrroloquinoline quinone biosynthesis peptide chaperone PqqD n=1 Tax=Pseudonocardia acaciae TaxID=551276 RepID=UPI000A9E878B
MRTRTEPPRLAPHVRLVFDRARGRHVLLGPESVVVLNRTGADIVGLCDGRRTVAEIAAGLRGRYDDAVEDEVYEFLDRLVARRWVVVDDG